MKSVHNVNTLCAIGKGKDDNYRAECCIALRKLFQLTGDKGEAFTATVWVQINDFICNTYQSVVSPLPLLKVIHSLSLFYENTSNRKIVQPIWIKNLYPNLAKTISCLVSFHKHGDESSEAEYETLMYLAYEANLCILKTFASRAFEDFCKMKPALDTLLHRRRSSYEIRMGLKMYSDFIRKSSFNNCNPLECYSYAYRHKLVPAIVKFLNDERFNIIDATCRLVLTLVHHGGPVFEDDMHTILPVLLSLMRRYNESRFCSEMYSINQSTVGKDELAKRARNLAKVIAEATHSIFSYYDVTIDPIKGMELLIFSIILCDVEKDWDKVYVASQHLFRSFEVTAKTKFMVIWDISCRFLTKTTQEGDCFIEMLMVASHILKKSASILHIGHPEDIPRDQSYVIMVFYEKITDILKKYKACLAKDKKESEEKKYKYNTLLTNLYLTHKFIYSPITLCWAHPQFKELLPTCDYMLHESRQSYEHKFAILLHTDMIEALSEDRNEVCKYKDKLMPIALKALTQADLDISSAAIRLFGKVSIYGGLNYRKDCKTALPLIARLLRETKVCKSELRLVFCAAQIREAASSTMAKIMETYKYRGGNEYFVLSQWLDSFPVVMNQRDAEISYELLMTLVRAGNKVILGPNNENMPRIFSVMCYAIHYNVFERRSEVIRKMEKLMRDCVVCCSGAEYNYLMGNLTADTRKIVATSIKNAPKCFKI